jgi:8-oxo-dGTP diphosphatase
VLLRPDGAVLLADRPAGKPYAGYWEFPGGKIEPGEDVQQALARELNEELGIDIGQALPWFVFEYDYPHAYVRLHFRRVFGWRGTPHAREGQQLAFFNPAASELPQPLLPAAVPALRWLTLPPVCELSAASAPGIDTFLARLDAQLAQGLRMVLLHEPQLTEAAVGELLPQVLSRCRAHGARVLVSSAHDGLMQHTDGLLLLPDGLAQVAARPSAPWVGAMVRDAGDLAQAARIGCDFVVAGPVLPSPQHAEVIALGWHGFSALALTTPMPMYATGGLAAVDLDRAQHAGAHGLALGAIERSLSAA